MTVPWRGVFPAATTQFHSDQSLDLEATAKHLELMLAAGVHGLIVLGTVGENCSLEHQEKLRVLRMAVEQVAGRVPVLSGVAECSTALACRFAADAERAGADGLMVFRRWSTSRTRAKRWPISAPWPRPAACRSCATTIRFRTASTLRPRCSPNWPTSRSSRPSRNRARTCAASPI